MAKVAKTVVASATADATTEASMGALVGDASDTTTPAPDAVVVTTGSDVAPVTETEVAPTVEAKVSVWPKAAVLRNHSGNSLVEPITGKFLAAGGSEPIELQDQEHEDAVAANAIAISANVGQSGALALDFL